MSVVESRFSVYHVVGVRANDVVTIFRTEVVCFAVRVIHLLIIQIQILSMNRQIFLNTLHNPSHLQSISKIALIVEVRREMIHFVNGVEVVLIRNMIVERVTCLSMSITLITIRHHPDLTHLHIIHHHNSFTVVNTVEVRTLIPIVKQGTRLSMSMVLVTIMIIRITTNLHSIK